MKKFQKNNKGYSLIELMVVIAILAFAVSGIAISIAVVFANNVRACAADMGAFISMGKVNSNYRTPVVCIEFIKENGNIVARYYEKVELDPDDGLLLELDPVTGLPETGVLIETKIIGSANIPLATTGIRGVRDVVPDVDAGDIHFLPDDEPIRIVFERGTGIMREVVDGELVDFDEARPTITLGTPGQANCYIIELIPYTGGHEITKG